EALEEQLAQLGEGQLVAAVENALSAADTQLATVLPGSKLDTAKRQIYQRLTDSSAASREQSAEIIQAMAEGALMAPIAKIQQEQEPPYRVKLQEIYTAVSQISNPEELAVQINNLAELSHLARTNPVLQRLIEQSPDKV